MADDVNEEEGSAEAMLSSAPLTEEPVMLEEVYKELRAGIEKAVEALRRDLSKVRTGRAHAGMLDSIRVDYYGQPTPINQMTDGELIRLPIPPLTEERRKEMVKMTKKHGEESKVAVRKHRRDALEMIDTLDKDGDVPADDADRGKKKVEEMVADGVKQIEHVVEAKEKEILVV